VSCTSSHAGHSGSVAAVSFNAAGDTVVTYSPDENPPTLRSWSVGPSGWHRAWFSDAYVVGFDGCLWYFRLIVLGFLSGILGLQAKHSRLYKLPPLQAHPAPYVNLMERMVCFVKCSCLNDASVHRQVHDAGGYVSNSCHVDHSHERSPDPRGWQLLCI